jgi:hypothetical protein
MASFVPADDRFADSGVMEFIDLQSGEEKPTYSDIEAADYLTTKSPAVPCPEKDIEMSVIGDEEVFDLVHDVEKSQTISDDDYSPQDYKDVELSDDEQEETTYKVRNLKFGIPICIQRIRVHKSLGLIAKCRSLPVKAKIGIGIIFALVILFAAAIVVALLASDLILRHSEENTSNYVTAKHGGVAGDCKIVCVEFPPTIYRFQVT